MYRTGGIFSIFCSLCYLSMGIFIILQPVLLQDAKVDLFLNTMADKPSCFILYYLAIALSAMFGLGTVKHITDFFVLEDNELLRWSQKLAYIGYAVLALSYFRVYTVKPYMANFYSAASQTEKDTILTMDPYISFAPNGIVTYGFIGVWLLIICIYALKNKSGLMVTNIIGILLGLILIAVTYQNVPAAVTGILNTARGIISFIWFGLVGIFMLRKKREQ